MKEEESKSENTKAPDESRIKMRNAVERLRSLKREIEAKEDQTMGELMDELQLSSAPVLLEVDGEIFRLNEIKDRKVSKGDKVGVIPLIAGG